VLRLYTIGQGLDTVVTTLLLNAAHSRMKFAISYSRSRVPRHLCRVAIEALPDGNSWSRNVCCYPTNRNDKRPVRARCGNSCRRVDHGLPPWYALPAPSLHQRGRRRQPRVRPVDRRSAELPANGRNVQGARHNAEDGLWRKRLDMVTMSRQ